MPGEETLRCVVCDDYAIWFLDETPYCINHGPDLQTLRSEKLLQGGVDATRTSGSNVSSQSYGRST